MQQIENLITSLSADKSAIDSQLKKRSQLNALFVNPQLSGGDFYKMILPALVLQTTDVIATAFAGISRFNPTRQFKNREQVKLTSQQIIWAHRFIFPFTNESLVPTFRSIKQLNPNAKIIYHVDFNFLTLPANHPYHELFTDKEKAQVIQNIAEADKVILVNKSIRADIIKEMQSKMMFVDLSKFHDMIMCIDEKIMLQGILPPMTISNNQEIHICVVCSDNQLNDLKACIEDIKELKKKYKANITIYGVNKVSVNDNNKNTKVFQEIVGDLQYTHEPPVPLTRFLLKLNQINPDLIFIPSDKSEYTQSSSGYKRFLDAGLLFKPCISPTSFPLSKIIEKESQNGYLYESREDLFAVMDEVVKTKGKERGAGAGTFVREFFSYNKEKIQYLINTIA